MKLKAWACDLCEKSFGEKRDMTRHKNAVHFGIKSKNSFWKCPECDIVFKLRREYEAHKTAYHSLLSDHQIVKFLNSEDIVSASTDSQLKLWNINQSHCARSFTGRKLP